MTLLRSSIHFLVLWSINISPLRGSSVLSLPTNQGHFSLLPRPSLRTNKGQDFVSWPLTGFPGLQHPVLFYYGVIDFNSRSWAVRNFHVPILQGDGILGQLAA